MPPAPPRSRQRARSSSLPVSSVMPSIGPSSAPLDCLTAVDAVDLGELGEQLGVEIDGRPARDVVDDHPRAAGRARDLLVVADDAAAVRAVVVAGDGEQRLGAGLRHALGEVAGVVRAVGARARHDQRLAAQLLDHQGHERDHLVVAERRRLAGRPAHDQAVGAVGEQMPAERDRPLLVHAAVRVEGGDHRGQQALQRTHGSDSGRRGGAQRCGRCGGSGERQLRLGKDGGRAGVPNCASARNPGG